MHYRSQHTQTQNIWRNKYYGEDNDSDDNDFQSNVCWYCKLIWIKEKNYTYKLLRNRQKGQAQKPN